MKTLYLRSLITMLLVFGLLIGSIVYFSTSDDQPQLQADTHELPVTVMSQVEPELVCLSDVLTT